MGKKSTIFVLLVLMSPVIFSSTSSSYFIQTSSAENACSGDIDPINWNQTIGYSALVPHYNYYQGYKNWDWDDNFDEDDRRNNGRDHKSDYSDYPQVIREPSVLNPEPEWTYQDWDRSDKLQRLTTNHYTSIVVGNDSIAALRLNLSAEHRTTFCITLQNLNQSGESAVADVYLMTSSEFWRYSESYYTAHSDFYILEELEETVSDIPPEWRSLNPIGWRTYRDVHQYESVSSVNFALTLDSPESYTPLFGQEQWEYFYLVIDTWDNGHDDDQTSPDAITAADVTIITTERSIILPNYTVAIVFLIILLGILAFPFVLNARYMKAGLVAVNQDEQGVVPSLETNSDYSTMNEENSSEKNYPELEES